MYTDMCCNFKFVKKYNNMLHRLFFGLLIIGFVNKISFTWELLSILTYIFPLTTKLAKRSQFVCSNLGVTIFLPHACRHSQGAQRLINEPFI